MYLVFVVTSFRGVGFILLHTCDCVHRAVRMHKQQGVVFPIVGLHICVYVRVRVRHSGCTEVVFAGTPTKRWLMAAIFLLIHKCQGGSLWGNDKRLKAIQSLLYESNLKGNIRYRAHFPSLPRISLIIRVCPHLSLSISITGLYALHQSCFGAK